MNFSTRVLSHITNPVSQDNTILCTAAHVLKLESYKHIEILTGISIITCTEGGSVNISLIDKYQNQIELIGKTQIHKYDTNEVRLTLKNKTDQFIRIECDEHIFIYKWVSNNEEHQSVVDTPVIDTPVVDTPVVDTSVVDTPVVDTSVVDTPVVDTPVVDTPVVDAPVVDTPVIDTPVVDTPVVDTPVVDTPVVDTPVIDTPVVDTPVVDTPVVDTPVVDAPVVDTPVVDAPVVDTPVVDAPVVDAPVVDTPVVDAPVVDAPVESINDTQSSKSKTQKQTIIKKRKPAGSRVGL
jgi:hypothetical protein